MDTAILDPAAFGRGAALSASLIVAIGAQNAFVLRQGIRREHVFSVSLLCALSDASLIAAGVLGLGATLANFGDALVWMSWIGAGYLLLLALQAAKRALFPAASPLTLASEDRSSKGRIWLATLAFTFLNPHVYLDTIVLLGSVGAKEWSETRLSFAMGAMTASTLWFFTLGFGARLMAPLFVKPRAWRILDGGIAIVMLMAASSLLS